MEKLLFITIPKLGYSDWFTVEERTDGNLKLVKEENE